MHGHHLICMVRQRRLCSPVSAMRRILAVCTHFQSEICLHAWPSPDTYCETAPSLLTCVCHEAHPACPHALPWLTSACMRGVHPDMRYRMYCATAPSLLTCVCHEAHPGCLHLALVALTSLTQPGSSSGALTLQGLLMILQVAAAAAAAAQHK
jgi:hypothetical protein